MTDWAGLRDRAGEVLLPGDEGYEYLSPKYLGVEPGAFVRPGDAVEVAAALAFARVGGLAVSIRSGGHGASIFPSPGGLVIDLARFDTVEVATVVGSAWARASRGARSRRRSPTADSDSARATPGRSVSAG